MKKLINLVLIAIVCYALSAGIKSAFASPGALDSSGCHHAGKSGYHCHPQKAKGQALGVIESPADKQARIKKQCATAPNPAACRKRG